MLRIIDAEFSIAPDRVVPAFEELITFYHDIKDEPFFEGAFPKKLAEAADLASFFDTLEYLLGFDDDKGVDYIASFEATPYRGDEYLFATLAPFVTAGSFIELQIGTDYYRWEFNGKLLMEFKGEIYYTQHTLVDPRDYTKIDLERDDTDDDTIRFPEYEDDTRFEIEPAPRSGPRR